MSCSIRSQSSPIKYGSAVQSWCGREPGRRGRCKGAMTPLRRLAPPLLAPLLLALAALAVLVPAAQAKELMALKACGPGGCRDVDDPSRLVGGVIEGDPGEP